MFERAEPGPAWKQHTVPTEKLVREWTGAAGERKWLMVPHMPESAGRTRVERILTLLNNTDAADHGARTTSQKHHTNHDQLR
jgi:hypothetical protein